MEAGQLGPIIVPTTEQGKETVKEVEKEAENPGRVPGRTRERREPSGGRGQVNALLPAPSGEEPTPCAPGAGTGVAPHEVEDGSRSPSAACPEPPFDRRPDDVTPAARDPNLAGEPSDNLTEPAGAGSDPSPVPPSSSNLSWAQFSEPGVLACNLVRGAARGVHPKGMEPFFKTVKHNASCDAFQARHGLFPLPVDLMRPAQNGWEKDPVDPRVTSWTQLTCLALNKLSGWSGAVPTQRKGIKP